ncbi:hypothetical protein BP5796_10220 [Coleophoma crateriformis]|uniref:C2H2-type domain-containing protein n=1 Tax=Coleophoma crateriformis TaxID=565419 RepID=A0A3D8QV06_9HELO|nr:hypothetical protein BP5796_10220 [Coleophoma crateriformis]
MTRDSKQMLECPTPNCEAYFTNTITLANHLFQAHGDEQPQSFTGTILPYEDVAVDDADDEELELSREEIKTETDMEHVDGNIINSNFVQSLAPLPNSQRPVSNDDDVFQERFNQEYHLREQILPKQSHQERFHHEHFRPERFLQGPTEMTIAGAPEINSSSATSKYHNSVPVPPSRSRDSDQLWFGYEREDQEQDDKEQDDKEKDDKEHDDVAPLSHEESGKNMHNSSRGQRQQGKAENPRFEYVCQVRRCSRRFKDKIGLNIHHSAMHPDQPRPFAQPAPPELPYKCTLPGCGRSFTTSSGLGNHLGRSHPEYRRDAESTRLIRCRVEGCLETFSTKSAVSIHHTQAHSNSIPNPWNNQALETLFTCKFPNCRKTTKVPGGLRKHYETVHPDFNPDDHEEKEFPHKCTVCGQSFERSIGLTLHMTALHPEPKPLAPSLRFRCNIPFCTRSFDREGALKNHKRVAHPSSESEEDGMFFCPVLGCRRFFDRPGSLAAHITHSHPGFDKRNLSLSGTNAISQLNGRNSVKNQRRRNLRASISQQDSLSKDKATHSLQLEESDGDDGQCQHSKDILGNSALNSRRQPNVGARRPLFPDGSQKKVPPQAPSGRTFSSIFGTTQKKQPVPKRMVVNPPLEAETSMFVTPAPECPPSRHSEKRVKTEETQGERERQEELYSVPTPSPRIRPTHSHATSPALTGLFTLSTPSSVGPSIPQNRRIVRSARNATRGGGSLHEATHNYQDEHIAIARQHLPELLPQISARFHAAQFSGHPMEPVIDARPAKKTKNQTESNNFSSSQHADNYMENHFTSQEYRSDWPRDVMLQPEQRETGTKPREPSPSQQRGALRASLCRESQPFQASLSTELSKDYTTDVQRFPHSIKPQLQNLYSFESLTPYLLGTRQTSTNPYRLSNKNPYLSSNRDTSSIHLQLTSANTRSMAPKSHFAFSTTFADTMKHRFDAPEASNLLATSTLAPSSKPTGKHTKRDAKKENQERDKALWAKKSVYHLTKSGRKVIRQGNRNITIEDSPPSIPACATRTESELSFSLEHNTPPINRVKRYASSVGSRALRGNPGTGGREESKNTNGGSSAKRKRANESITTAPRKKRAFKSDNEENEENESEVEDRGSEPESDYR